MKKDETKKKKKWPYVLLVIFLIIGALVGFVALNASKNMKVMNSTLDEGMDTLSGYAAVRSVDPGEYSEIKMYGLMKFDVTQHEIEDLGNLSVMKVNMGFMQMVSYVITPYEKNMPMLSMDFMYIMGKRKAYAEFYDLVADKTTPEYTKVLEKLKELKSKYSDLEDVQIDPAWYDELVTVGLYKAGKRDDDDRITEMFSDAVKCYMELADGMEQLSAEEKAEKQAITQKYCDDLVEQGGVSTDVFKKQLGEEKTKDFFNKVMFGPELYK